MSTYPRLESRVSVLERRQITLEARVEELSEDTTARFNQIDTHFNQVDTRVEGLSKDMTASFRQLVEYHIQTENQLDTRFNQVDGRLDKIENRLDKIEATMATKEDLKTEIAAVRSDIKEDLKTEIAAVRSDIKNDVVAMENRILDAFKQLIVQVTQQRPPSQ